MKRILLYNKYTEEFIKLYPKFDEKTINKHLKSGEWVLNEHSAYYRRFNNSISATMLPAGSGPEGSILTRRQRRNLSKEVGNNKRSPTLNNRKRTRGRRVYQQKIPLFNKKKEITGYKTIVHRLFLGALGSPNEPMGPCVPSKNSLRLYSLLQHL